MKRRGANDKVALNEERSFTSHDQLVLIEATSTKIQSSGRWTPYVLLVGFAIGLLFAVREIARIERTLTAEGALARRVVVYEVLPGKEFRVPMEPDTEVFRLVMHLLRRGPISPENHLVKLAVTVRGAQGTRTEELIFSAPWTTDRVKPEDPGIVVGDPVGANVEVTGLGAGDLTLALKDVEGADGLLVRVYRRESLKTSDALRQRENIEIGKREHLARRAGEIDWTDLDDGEHSQLLAARWKRVAVLSDSGHELTPRAIALAPAPSKGSKVTEPVAWSRELRANAKAAVIAHGPVSVVARDHNNPQARITATLRDESGTVKREMQGEASIEVKADQVTGIEFSLQEEGSLAISASDVTKLELPTKVAYWRVTPKTPALIQAGMEPLVVRVGCRRVVASDTPGPFTLSLRVSTAVGKVRTEEIITSAEFRSDYDGYDGRGDAVSEKVERYVLVPRGGLVSLAPVDGVLDISISELDPTIGPKHIPAASARADAPKRETMVKVGAADWKGFVPRRPTNLGAFDGQARGFFAVAHRFEPLSSRIEADASFRFTRPPAAKANMIGERMFEPAGLPLPFTMVGGVAIALPVHLQSAERVEVVAEIDGDVPLRRATGLVAHLTTARSMTVEGEVTATIVLGDDLAPGPHVLTFLPATPGTKLVQVHVPWAAKKSVAPPKKHADSHWVAADSE